MKIEKQVLEAAVDSLMERAQDSFRRAKAQHALADVQHANADAQNANAEQLVTLGEMLETDAISLAGEIEMCASRAILQLPRTVSLPASIVPTEKNAA